MGRALFVLVLGCTDGGDAHSPALLMAIGAEARVLTLEGQERGVVYTSASVEPVRALAFDPVRDLLYSMQGPTMVGFFVRDGVEHRAVIRDERYRSAFAFDGGALGSDQLRTYAGYRERILQGECCMGDVMLANGLSFGTPAQIVAERTIDENGAADLAYANDGTLYVLRVDRVLLREEPDLSWAKNRLPIDPSAASFSALTVVSEMEIFVGAEEGRRAEPFATMFLRVDHTGEVHARMNAPVGVSEWHVYSLDAREGRLVAAVRLDDWVGLLFTDSEFSTLELVEVRSASRESPIRSVTWTDFPEGVVP
jgi:hypothetical protein